MRDYLCVLVTALALGSPLACADGAADGATALLERGIAAYLKADATAALREWVKGGAMEANTQALSQANVLRQIEDFYGKPQGYDLVHESILSSRARTLYFTINYETGLSFGRLTVYRKDDGTWVTTSFLFHTEAAQIFPASLLGD
ncbi:MAG: hypothetical protein AB7G76_10855 [Steroidobacteraceae bacterium]